MQVMQSPVPLGSTIPDKTDCIKWMRAWNAEHNRYFFWKEGSQQTTWEQPPVTDMVVDNNTQQVVQVSQAQREAQDNQIHYGGFAPQVTQTNGGSAQPHDFHALYGTGFGGPAAGTSGSYYAGVNQGVPNSMYSHTQFQGTQGAVPDRAYQPQQGTPAVAQAQAQSVTQKPQLTAAQTTAQQQAAALQAVLRGEFSSKLEQEVAQKTDTTLDRSSPQALEVASKAAAKGAGSVGDGTTRGQSMENRGHNRGGYQNYGYYGRQNNYGGQAYQPVKHTGAPQADLHSQTPAEDPAVAAMRIKREQEEREAADRERARREKYEREKKEKEMERLRLLQEEADRLLAEKIQKEMEEDEARRCQEAPLPSEALAHQPKHKKWKLKTKMQPVKIESVGTQEKEADKKVDNVDQLELARNLANHGVTLVQKKMKPGKKKMSKLQ